MAPQNPVPPPPLPPGRPSFERAPLGSGPRRGPPPPGRRPPPKQGNGLLTWVLYFFLFVLLAGGAGAGYLLVNPPSDLIRQKIAEEVKARTGRDLVIAGRASFKFFPDLAISLKDVSLSGPPGSESALLHTHALEVSLKAMSLLSRQPEITSVTLKKPVFDFRIAKDGQRNWKFAARQGPTRLAELQPRGSLRDTGSLEIADAEAAPDAPRIGEANNLKLNNVTLEDGTFRFTDERSGKTSEVSEVNVSFGLPSVESPLVANGNLIWHDHRLDFDGKVDDVRSLLSEKPAHLSFNAKNPLISASYDGGLTIRDGASLDGQVTAEADSTRGLADWFGTKLPPVTGFGPMSIQGTLKTSDNVTMFSNAVFGLDGAAAKGIIKVTTGGVRPFVEANLAVSELDLNKYLTTAVTGEAASQDSEHSGSTPSAPAAPEPQDPDQIQKLLQGQQGTKVYAFEQRAGWSSEPLNLTLLGVADGNARVSVGKIHFKNVSIGQSSVDVAVKDHAMQATFNDVALYQGHGKGVLTFDGSSGTANIGSNFSLDNVSALPFLKDAVNFGWVSGNANVQFQLAANGANQLQLVESLNGTAGFQFADGAVVGFNLPGAIRGLSQGNFAALRTSPSEKTDFSALAATFTIANGVAQNQDLQLVSPMLRVTGGGTVHMPERTVDYTVKPRLIASLEGQGGDAAASGIEVPVHITGSWDHPNYRPDLKGVLSDPNKTVDAIKQIGKKLKGKSASEIVDSLFGKKGDNNDATDPNAGTKQKAKDLLNKFLGKQDDGN